MRMRTFRPFVDQLGVRLMLDASPAPTFGTPTDVSTPTISTDSSMPGDDIDLASTCTWNLDGDPPVNPYDPANPPID